MLGTKNNSDERRFMKTNDDDEVPNGEKNALLGFSYATY